MSRTCLNCNQNIEGNYCSNCGQKTGTHRFSIKHFFVHDFIHGILHIDKGFLFTIKELFTRPGHSTREYIQGKRVNHFNYFATAILILAVNYFISKWLNVDLTRVFDKDSISGLSRILNHYSKIVAFVGIPVYALITYLLFRKSAQNYAENLVLNTYMLCGWLCLNLLMKFPMAFIENVETLRIINLVDIALIHIYLFIFYYQYFSAFGYKKLFLILRAVAATLIILTVKQQINNGLNEIGLRYFH